MVAGTIEKAAVWAVVPLKSLRGAKKRLENVLGEEEREALVTAMARDVLAALGATPGVDGVMVVSNAAEVAEIALEHDANLLPEGDERGLSEAVASAARTLAKDQAGAMMVVHADIPLARPVDFQTLIGLTAPLPSVTIAPCRNNDGTNVMICDPPDVIPFLYGPGSCTAHRLAARQAGVAVTVERVPGLALDIDTPEDLARLLEHHERGEAGPATARFLSGVDLSSRFG